jgi:transforming growth factor-beta-induced protein
MFIPPQDFITSAPAFNLSAFPGALFTGPPIILNYTNINPCLTVFAPYNLAFQRIESSLENLSVEDITSLLEYHLVPSNTTPYYSSNLPNGLPYSAENSSIYNQTTLKSLQGNDLSITFEYNSLFVNQARIIQSDLLLSNGVLHVIDSVLNPNKTSIAPVPTATTPIEAYQASSTGKGLPFTQALPTTTSELFSLVTETPSSTILSGPPGSTATEGGTLHSSVALGDRVMVGRVEMGWLFGVAVWILEFL